MKIAKLNCTACGAPMSIPDNLEQITCSSCGTSLVIDHGEGYIALKVAEKLTRAIEEAGYATQEVIRENTQVTRTEFQRLQLTQELSAPQMQLANVQAEIRLLERGVNNATSMRQLLSLHQTEYLAMERIHNLQTQISAPTLKTLPSRLDFSEWELRWILSEITALTQSNHPKRSQLLNKLTNRRSELTNTIYDLKIRVLKSKFSSFSKQDPPLDDQAQIVTLINLVDEDEKKLRDLRQTLEGKVVYREILQRQQKLREAWKRLEVVRIDGTLNSFGFRADFEDPVSLNDYLGRINQDLQSLTRAPANEVVFRYQTKLRGERKRTLKQIRKLQKAADGSNKTGFFAMILAGVAAFFGGVAILVKEQFSGSASHLVTTVPASHLVTTVPASLPVTTVPASYPVTTVPASHPVTTAPASQPVTTAPASGATAETAFGLKKNVDLKSIGLGCLIGMLTLLVFFVCTVVPLSILSQSMPILDQLGGGLFFIFMIVGFLLGSRAFFRRAAPQISIRGIAGLPDIVITPKEAGKGLKNPRMVKTLVGLVTWILVYLIFLALYLFIPDSGSTLGGMLLLIGIALGPVAAWLVVKRTSIALLE